MIKFHFIQQAPFASDIEAVWPTSGITAVFAPSGSGKTSLLRFFAGLAQKYPGQYLSFNEQVWQDGRYFLPAHQRPVACVFQGSNLLSHLSIKDNMTYVKRFNQAVITGQDQQDLMALCNIDALAKKYPHQLSGGEQQRVALARSLMQKPDWLLLDEPMTGIDVVYKQQLLEYIEQYSERYGIPILYISHHLDEIVKVADQLVLMDKGEVIDQGSVIDMVNAYHPSDDYSLGLYQLIEVSVKQVSKHLTKVQAGELVLNLPGTVLQKKNSVRLKIHARDVSLSLVDNPSSTIVNIIRATIIEIDNDPVSGQSIIKVEAFGIVIYSEISLFSLMKLKLHIGQRVFAQIKAVALVV